jgi:hypothetical protein
VTSEEFVKRYWDNTAVLCEKDWDHAEPWIFFTNNALYRSFRASSLERLWELGRQFTEERLAQIELVGEEIAYINNIMGKARVVAPHHAIHRILDREEDILAKLRKGMKP